MLRASVRTGSTIRRVGLKRLVLPSVLVCTVLASIPPLKAQDIRIRVLNGRTGKPITNECLNVWTGTGRGAHLVAATNKEGLAVLHFADSEVVAEAACQGWPAQATADAGVDGITLSGNRYVACQEYARTTPGEPPVDPLSLMPSYSVKKVLESGMSTANTCGKFRTGAKPGELIFYVRPRSLWERAKQ